MGLRLLSLAALIAAWWIGSQLAGERLLPAPQAVAAAIVAEARSGALAFVAVMLVIETFLVQPLERHVSRWRPRKA